LVEQTSAGMVVALTHLTLIGRTFASRFPGSFKVVNIN